MRSNTPECVNERHIFPVCVGLVGDAHERRRQAEKADKGVDNVHQEVLRMRVSVHILCIAAYFRHKREQPRPRLTLCGTGGQHIPLQISPVYTRADRGSSHLQTYRGSFPRLPACTKPHLSVNIRYVVLFHFCKLYTSRVSIRYVLLSVRLPHSDGLAFSTYR